MTFLELIGRIFKIKELLPKEPKPKPAPEPNPEPEPPAHAGEGDGFPPAGVSQSNVFLWKAESETERGVAVLLPARLRGHCERIQIQHQGGTQDVNRHRTNEPWVNGARPHFFTFRAAHTYQGPVVVRAILNDGITEAFPVQNPAIRTEYRR